MPFTAHINSEEATNAHPLTELLPPVHITAKEGTNAHPLTELVFTTCLAAAAEPPTGSAAASFVTGRGVQC